MYIYIYIYTYVYIYIYAFVWAKNSSRFGLWVFPAPWTANDLPAGESGPVWSQSGSLRSAGTRGQPFKQI